MMIYCAIFFVSVFVGWGIHKVLTVTERTDR